MDPLSITLGVGTIVQMSVQLGMYLKNVYDAAASFEGEIEFLMREIQDVESINASIEQLYRTETGPHIFGQQQLAPRESDLWQNTMKTILDCSNTVQDLHKVLEAITRRSGAKITGWRDGIKKQLRKQTKDGELGQIRLKLSAQRESLSVSLTLLNLTYTQRGTKDAQQLGFKLHRQIASLQSRLPMDQTDDMYESLRSATTFASTLNLNKYFDTPKTVSNIYTGRKGYLEGLKQAYDSSHTSPERSPMYRRFVVFGLGGSGKTQFCCKFASDNKQRFWGVFTVDASSPGNAQQSFIAIAKACGTDPNERAAKSWLSSCDRPWLLLIDNADDTNLEVERYFPDGEHGLTLVTTRNPSVKMHGTIGERFYHFDRLDDEEASELLLKAAENKEPWTTTTMQLASAITRKLGALPLALVHAGNAIKARYCELSNYIPFYEKSWQMIRQSQHASGRDEDNAEYLKVYASYEIVFRGLEAIKSPRYRDAVQILKLFSFLHHEHIPFKCLVAAVENPRIQREADARETERINNNENDRHASSWKLRSWSHQFIKLAQWIFIKRVQFENPVLLPTFLRDSELIYAGDIYTIRLREALHLLTQLSLVTHYENSDSYSMHPLVHTWVRERPQMTVRDQAVWCETALHTISRCLLLPPMNEVVDPHEELARSLLPHVISVSRYQKKIEGDFAHNRYRRNRLWPAIGSRINPWRALFLAKSALCYSACGDFAETEKCLRTVMDFNRGFLGPNHPRTEKVRLAVSDCLWQQCRVNEAADLQEQILHDNISSLGTDHPRTLRLMDKLGESRRYQGRFAESIDLLSKCIGGMQAQLPNTDPAIYHAFEQLGITMRTCFHFEDANDLLERAVTGLKRNLGEGDLRTLLAMEELAIAYKDFSASISRSNKDLAQVYLETARRHAISVVKGRTRLLGDRQPLTWLAQGTCARIEAAMGNVDEAEKVFSTILPVAARHIGEDHIGVLSHKNHYSKILIQQSRYTEAETILLDISKAAHYQTVSSTGDHPDRWDALWTLVECYQKQAKIDAGLKTCNELLQAVEAIQKARPQTKISSTFWQMVLAKKAELSGIKQPSLVKEPDQILLGAPLGMDYPATTSSYNQALSLPGLKYLKTKGTTW